MHVMNICHYAARKSIINLLRKFGVLSKNILLSSFIIMHYHYALIILLFRLLPTSLVGNLPTSSYCEYIPATYIYILPRFSPLYSCAQYDTSMHSYF